MESTDDVAGQRLHPEMHQLDAGASLPQLDRLDAA
jgi:hypothetical protein